MLRSESVIRLHELKGEGKSIRGIARETGKSRNTIRKYLRSKGIPESQPRPQRPSKLDPYKPIINDLLRQGIYNCEVILPIIKEQGYQGSHSILREYVKPFRPPRQTPAVQRYETKPGEHAQVDWGIGEYVDKEGVLHKAPVFVMVLGYSRMRYIEFTKRCDIYSFLRCLIHAFEYFGGVTKVMLTDRMRTVILGTADDGTPKWHPLFADFAATIGLVPKVCKARRPQTKGKVERSVRYIKENFLPGRIFIDFDDLNRQARNWCDLINQKVHGTTGEKPVARLDRERLLPLPAPHEFLPFLREQRKVSKDAFVSFDGVLYGVPWRFSGRSVFVRDMKGVIEIWADGQCIAEHQRRPNSKAVVPCPHQYEGLKAAGGMAYPKPMARQIPEVEVENRSLALYDRLAGVSA